MHILLVEDDPHIARFLQRGLRAEGFLVQHADDGLQGLSMAESSDIDVIILDLLLPGMDGRELCRQLRARDVHTPVLMLSALDRLDDKVHGFSIGADDYLA
ncbi:MAG: response regulator, partial [Gammaproteobacteria bacterium]|nr:response regulator [Gammaproteobacteria bacterium]